MPTAKAKNKAETTCLFCNPPDLHEVGPEQRKYLQELRHRHFLSFDNGSELGKHLRMVYPSELKPMTDSIQYWFSARKINKDLPEIREKLNQLVANIGKKGK